MLSTTSGYALRALVELATLPPGASLLGRELARRSRIPANYLSKVLVALGRAGLITAVRGRGGGYRLCKRADRIRLIEVVCLFEKQKGKPTCLLGRAECSDATACSAHQRWKVVRKHYEQFLKSTTLARVSGLYSGRSGGRER